jgi:hypothetical protein
MGKESPRNADRNRKGRVMNDPHDNAETDKKAMARASKLTPTTTAKYNGRAWSLFYSDGDTERPICTFRNPRAEVWAKRTAVCLNSHDALVAACQHAAMSPHHPACKCKGEYSANPEQYCTCHVQKAVAALAAARGPQ